MAGTEPGVNAFLADVWHTLVPACGRPDVARHGTAVSVAVLAAQPLAVCPRYARIVVLSVAMGAQHATARKLAVRDLTPTVLTLIITGVLHVHVVSPLVIALLISMAVAVTTFVRTSVRG